MSYCEIIEFACGLSVRRHEFGNSYGGAAYIWGNVYDKYLADESAPFGDSWLMGFDRYAQAAWDIVSSPELPMFMRAAYASQYDYMLIDRVNFSRFAADLRKFVSYYGTQGKVCHLLAWADVFDSLDPNTTEATGFYPTSVSDCLWEIWDEDQNTYKPYDLTTGTKHRYLYACLAEMHDPDYRIQKIPWRI